MLWRNVFVAAAAGVAVLVGAGSASAFPTGSGYVHIVGTKDTSLYFNAYACADDTNVVLWTYTTSCDHGNNESWIFYELSSGYDSVYTNYSGNYDCLNVYQNSYAEFTKIYAWKCSDPTNPSSNEMFRRPENTPDDNYTNAAYLIPANQPDPNQYCLNAHGGLSSGNQIILYDCNSMDDEAWSFVS